MKKEIELLIEDYKRRIEKINELLDQIGIGNCKLSEEDVIKQSYRLATKESCYKTIVSELEKIIKNSEK